MEKLFIACALLYFVLMYFIVKDEDENGKD